MSTKSVPGKYIIVCDLCGKEVEKSFRIALGEVFVGDFGYPIWVVCRKEETHTDKDDEEPMDICENCHEKIQETIKILIFPQK